MATGVGTPLYIGTRFCSTMYTPMSVLMERVLIVVRMRNYVHWRQSANPENGAMSSEREVITRQFTAGLSGRDSGNPTRTGTWSHTV
jgi:hypothetical protein